MPLNKLRPIPLFIACCIMLATTVCYAITETDGWGMVDGILRQIQPPSFPDCDFPVTDYGAKGDNHTDCTTAFAKAIHACNAVGGGRIVVPMGTFLTGAIHLESNVNLHLEKGAVISFSTDANAYLPLVYTRFEGTECMNYSPLVYAYGQTNLAITGEGTFEGNANKTNWWKWKSTQKSDITALRKMDDDNVPVEKRRFGSGHYLRPNMIQPYRCRNILIEGVTIKNSPMWHIHPVLSENVTVRGVTVVGLGPNNDGCNPECCRNVLIEKCRFDNGDDCIAIKSGRNNDGRRVNVPSENIIIRDCAMKDGHGGVVIGSEVSGSVSNVFAEDCTMDSPNLERGLRIKTNAARGGTIENIFMRNVVMRQVKEAALKINFYYGEADKGSFPPKVRNVFMTNVHCYKSRYPWHIRGFENNKIQHVVLKNCSFENTKKKGVSEGIEDFQVIPKAPPSIHGDWAEQMARTVMERNADLKSLDFASHLKWSYTYGLVLNAMWPVWEKSRDPDILAYIKSYYDALINEDGSIKTYDPSKYNIDMIIAGRALMLLYDQTGKEKYNKAVMTLRNQMKDQPRTSEGGFWHKKRYPHQMWLDGLYMGSPFLAQFAKRFDEPALFDDVASQIILMHKYARDPKTGLLYHGWDESLQQKWANPDTGCSSNFWGRAMGWYSMAIVDVLDNLPADHPVRPTIIGILDHMFTALAQVQDPETGLWYQVLDQGNRDDNYLEATASSMFVYSMAKAVRKGYVDSKFFGVACKGYQGLLDHLVTVDEKGWINIRQCCSVAGLGGNPYRDGSLEYYLGEPVRDNDPKAIGPFILAALEFERN